MDEHTISVVLITALAIAATASIAFLINSNGMMQAYGYGEDTSKAAAIEEAKKDALGNLASQLYVYVKNDSKLKMIYNITSDSTKLKGEFKQNFEKALEVKTELDLLNAKTKILNVEEKNNGSFLAKAQAEIKKETASKILLAFVAINSADGLINSKMLYTAHKIALMYEKLLKDNPYSIPPKYANQLIEKISKIENKWNNIMPLINQLKEKPKTVSEAVKKMEILGNLTNICVDHPEIKSIRKELQTKAKIKIEINAPNMVVKSQVINVEFKTIPAIKGTFTFNISTTDIDANNKITLTDGQGNLFVKIIGNRPKISIDLANILKSSHSFGTALEPTLSNISKILTYDIEKNKVGKGRIVILPENIENKKDIIFANTLENFLKDDNLLTVEKLSELFDVNPEKRIKCDVIFTSRDENGVSVNRYYSKKILAAITNETDNLKESELIKYAKALVMSNQEKSVIKLPENSYEMKYIKGIAYKRLGMFNEAEGIFKGIENKNINAKIELADVYYNLGMSEKAIEKAKECLKIDDGNREVYSIMAKSFLKLKDERYFFEALQDLYPAIKRIKNFDTGYYVLAILLRKGRNPEEAEEWVLKALSIKEEPDYYLEYARILIDQSKYTKAKDIVNKLSHMNLNKEEKKELNIIKSKIKL